MINYKKGSQNKVADFLSRIKEQNIEVNANEIEISTCGTYHTSIENTQPYIVLQDIPVNKFKTQIIITKTDNNNTSSEINGNQILKISERQLSDKQGTLNFLKTYLIPIHQIGIFSESNNMHIYNKLQMLIHKLFNPDQINKFVKCSKRVTDINSTE